MAKLFPVVHCLDLIQATNNISLAYETHCDGVFLINHSAMTSSDFDYLVDFAVNDFNSDKFKIGVNYLDIQSNFDAIKKAHSHGVSMLWSDNSLTDSSDPDDEFIVHRTAKFASTHDMMFFGGVQFKYQPKTNYSIRHSITKAIPYVSVPTLSGERTGSPASAIKIREAHSVSGETPLAIASGISIDNVHMYLPYIDYFLVASSLIDPLSKNETLDKLKLKQLSDIIHDFSYLEGQIALL